MLHKNACSLLPYICCVRQAAGAGKRETEVLMALGVSTRVGGAIPGHLPWRGLASCSWMLRPRSPTSDAESGRSFRPSKEQVF
ncbi:COMM domain-containing protein 6 isoform X2 [Pteropus alecto]|uniref:COMM domain-containing protein 6 isoform X2 n=1 Tax=Pteropus alecto TaxID=9402 RepID=UPI000D535E4F|nr:COMM domain-containing protein 6 isoform X2 [Pteropus alecto]